MDDRKKVLHIRPFHLSGICPNNSIRDVIEYCQKRGVNVTGSRLVHTRAWGTQSAKVFIDGAAEEKVLAVGFWLE